MIREGPKITIIFVLLFAYFVFEFVYFNKNKKLFSNTYYFDSSNNLVKEKIEQEWLLKFIYLTWMGQKIRILFKRKIVSQIYGWYQSSFLSKWKIKSFIKKYDIDIGEFQKSLEEFTSFNDFFTRKLKLGFRKIDQNENTVTSACDGKLFVIPDVSQSDTFFVKNQKFGLEKFLNDKKLAQEYENGTMLIFRLTPSDYHRFHFPLNCVPSKPKKISGNLESVNPLVYAMGLNPLIENERQLVVLKTEKFSDVLLVAVGALMVGKISFIYDRNQKMKKGDEVGFFEFGGSTIVLLFKNGAIKVSSRFVKNCEKDYETEVRMGQAVAEKII